MAPKRIALLGATGSIGLQTLDIVRCHPELYDVVALTAGSNVEALAALAREFKPKIAVIGRPELLPQLRHALEPLGIAADAGEEGLCRAAEMEEAEMTVVATVGYSGLAPTLHAIQAGKEIALANKETLVVAGEYVRRELEKHPESKLFPIDSEHSAIAQCLAGEKMENIRRLILTASGGPFREWPTDRIERATVEETLAHPNWQMGAKITVDSATMMNKAFEIVEARWLFDIEGSQIEAVVHPQSIVHSMVEFKDGAIKAQLGVPDMKLPIAYALGKCTRLADVSPRLTIERMSLLTFERPDYNKFPCLSLAQYSLSRGGTTACTVNAANEEAVSAFLRREIRFGDIYRIIERTLERATFEASPSYETYVASNLEGRSIAREIIQDVAQNV